MRLSIYSRCSKSGRPDFGVFRSCPVPKRPDFRSSSEIRTLLSGYRTSGSFQFVCPVIGPPVPIASNQTSDSRNRFQTGLEPVLVGLDDWNRFQTGFGSKSGQYCPDFRRLRYSKRPITGHLCPDFRRSGNWRWNPDNIVRISDVWDTVNVR